jgi:tetratricopeptide (TPR) repeat protein
VTHTDWLPGIVVLSIGLVAALTVLLIGRRRAPVRTPAEERRATGTEAAAEAGRRATRLLDQLRELEVDRHQLSPEAYAAERSRLEGLAANALRMQDEASSKAVPRKRSEPSPVPAPRGFFSRHPQLQGAFWGAGVVVFFGALALWLSREAQPRREGEGATGTAGRGEASTPPQEDPAFAAALARVRENPAEVDTSARVVHELIRREDFDEARELTDRSLGIDPFFPEARVHRAFLRAAAGDESGAAEELEHVTGLYPSAHEGLVFLGMLRMRAGNNRAALDAFDRFLAEAPPQETPPEMRAAIAALRQQLGGKPP